VHLSNPYPLRYYYLPYLSKFPTPTPIPVKYAEYFDDDDSGWFEGSYNDGDCSAEYRDNRYRTEADADEECYFPAPEDAEFKTGRAEVIAERGGGNNDFNYGVYINGQGGDDFYLLKIKFDGDECDWELFRKDSSKKSGSCDTESNDPDDDNTLALERISSTIRAYMNDTLLGTYTDSSPLSGEGTGLYIYADDDEEVNIRFDNFFVYN
jgi:hypothetical protein